METTAQPVRIKAGLANRMLVYWIPILLFVFGAKSFFVDVNYSYIETIKIIVTIMLFVLFFEYRIFGFQLQLYDDKLIYRQRGFPLFTKIYLDRENIVNYNHIYFDKKNKFKSAFLEINVENNSKLLKEYINIASFKSSDVRIFVEWLAHTTSKRTTT